MKKKERKKERVKEREKERISFNEDFKPKFVLSPIFGYTGCLFEFTRFLLCIIPFVSYPDLKY